MPIGMPFGPGATSHHARRSGSTSWQSTNSYPIINKNRPPLQVKGSAKHAHVKGDSTPNAGSDQMEDLRLSLNNFLRHDVTEVILALLVLVSLVLLVQTIDVTAPTEAYQELRRPPLLYVVADMILVVFFAIEAAMRIFVERHKYFTTSGTLNLAITAADLVCSLVEMFTGPGLPAVEVFRIFRLIRLVRLQRVVKFFPELGFLMQGIVSAFWTVFWGMVMIMLLLLVFSLLAVSVLHPINLRVSAEGSYGDCDRCEKAFSSVWDSFLTFTQTLLFGDSWGQLALPIITERWWAIGIFLLALAGIGLAAMNLILAAIVDSGAQAREAAIQSRSAAQRQIEAEEQKRHTAILMDLCSRIDSDESGRLSRQELLEGFERNLEFKQAMKGMHYTREDIEVFFNALDKDCSGDVDYAEFLGFMQDSKMLDLHQMMVFVKHAVMDLWRWKQKEEVQIHQQLQDLLHILERRLGSKDSPPTEVGGMTAGGMTGSMAGSWSFLEGQSNAGSTAPGDKDTDARCTVILREPPASLPTSSMTSTISSFGAGPEQGKRHSTWGPTNSGGDARMLGANLSVLASPDKPPRVSRVASRKSTRNLAVEDQVAEVNSKRTSKKEPKAVCQDKEALELSGSWHALEASSSGGPSASQAHQDVMKALKRIGHGLEANTGMLQDICTAVMPGWKTSSGSKDIVPGNPNEAFGFKSEFWSLPAANCVEEPLPVPPDPVPKYRHGQKPTQSFRVGI